MRVNEGWTGFFTLRSVNFGLTFTLWSYFLISDSFKYCLCNLRPKMNFNVYIRYLRPAKYPETHYELRKCHYKFRYTDTQHIYYINLIRYIALCCIKRWTKREYIDVDIFNNLKENLSLRHEGVLYFFL